METKIRLSFELEAHDPRVAQILALLKNISASSSANEEEVVAQAAAQPTVEKPSVNPAVNPAVNPLDALKAMQAAAQPTVEKPSVSESTNDMGANIEVDNAKNIFKYRGEIVSRPAISIASGLATKNGHGATLQEMVKSLGYDDFNLMIRAWETKQEGALEAVAFYYEAVKEISA